MHFTEPGLQLFQRYTKGCDVDQKHPEEMMPYSRLVKMAVSSGLKEINEVVVRRYFFKDHNGIVFALGRKNSSLQNDIDYCLVHPAMVGRVDGETLEVIYQPFFVDGKNFRFSGTNNKTIQKNGISDVEKGHFVSFHRGFAVEKLTPGEALELEQFNEDLVRSGLQ